MKQTTWKTYEEVARYLLEQNANAFGLTSVEGKQKIKGLKTGTEWEIDAKGIKEGNQGFIVVECRRYTNSRQTQGKLGQLAYSIIDTGARGGIIVSPIGIQEGADKIARVENIINVQLNADCTTTEFVMKFLNKVMIGVTLKATVVCVATLKAEVTRNCNKCQKKFTTETGSLTCPECLATLSSD
jgi:hypothetical protein